MTADGVIGVSGKLPWHCPADMEHFKRTTLNSTVIMGRRTWESLPSKPLPNRQNIVVSGSDGVGHCRTVKQALMNAAWRNVWFIGGAGIYREAIDYCDSMWITRIPYCVEHPESVYFPPVDWMQWRLDSTIELDKDLLCTVYVRQDAKGRLKIG